MSSVNEPRCLTRWVSSTEASAGGRWGQPEGEQHGEGDTEQQDREGDRRVEVALEGEIHGQRHRLSDAGHVAGEGDGRAELAERPGPAMTAPASSDGGGKRRARHEGTGGRGAERRRGVEIPSGPPR